MGGDGADSVFGAADPRAFHADGGSIPHQVQVLEPSPTLVVQRTSRTAVGADQAVVPALHFDHDLAGFRPRGRFPHLPRRLHIQESRNESSESHHSVGMRPVWERSAAGFEVAVTESAGIARAISR